MLGNLDVNTLKKVKLCAQKLSWRCCDSDFLFLLLQELKEKQREFERKATLLSQLAKEKSSSKDEAAFKNTLAPLQRKQPNVTKPNKQQAVVQPLQGQNEGNRFITEEGWAGNPSLSNFWVLKI